MLEEKAEVPVVGVVPYMSVTLDDEDSLAESLLPKDMDLINIGVVRLPRLSNFTDFSALDQIAGVSVHYVRDPYEIEKMDMVILPGTKNTMGDLAWMRESGMESAVKKFAQYGPVFGICGGYQMLGQRIADPEGIENVIKADGSEGLRGLELLPMETVLKPEKVRTQTSGVWRSRKARWQDFLLTGSMAMRSIWERPWQSMPSSLYAIWIRRMMWSARKETAGRETMSTAHMCMVFLMIRMWHMICAGFWQRKRD